jgi:CDP-4-dehydro-6-deoxyglucose reductase, E3
LSPYTIRLVSGASFTSGAGESILDAGLRAGVLMEHSCRSGRCSSCAAEVIEGDTLATLPEPGLAGTKMSAPPWILSCARVAQSDLLIDARTLDARLPPTRLSPAKIDRLERMSDGLLRVWLRLPPVAALEYLSGQYIDLSLPGGKKRSYSIANHASAGSSAHLELHIRRVDGGAMSDYFFGRAKAGDLLQLHGPKGSFFLRQPLPRALMLLATGTGLAPLQALLQQLACLPQAQRPERTMLFWGNRQACDFYTDPTALLPGLSYQRVISGPDDLPGAVRGRIPAYLESLGADAGATEVYACGSPAMIRDARARLQALGLPEGNFHADAFVSSI